MHDLHFVVTKYNMKNEQQLNINSMIRGNMAKVEVTTVRDNVVYSYEEMFESNAGDAIDRCKTNIVERMYNDGIK